MQNAGITALGLDWRYLAFDVHPDHLREAIAGARRMNFLGLNLTVPHKLLAVDIVDALDESARKWGAVNTIRFEARDAAGQWQPLAHFSDAIPGQIRAHGFNTDADAIVQSLREDLDAAFILPGASEFIAFGRRWRAGRVAALKLAEENPAELHLVNRTQSKANELAQKKFTSDFLTSKSKPAFRTMTWICSSTPPPPDSNWTTIYRWTKNNSLSAARGWFTI